MDYSLTKVIQWNGIKVDTKILLWSHIIGQARAFWKEMVLQEAWKECEPWGVSQGRGTGTGNCLASEQTENFTGGELVFGWLEKRGLS